MQLMELELAVKIAIIFSGIFLWVGMFTGVWKYLADSSIASVTRTLLCRYCPSQQPALCARDLNSGSAGLLFSVAEYGESDLRTGQYCIFQLLYCLLYAAWFPARHNESV